MASRSSTPTLPIGASRRRTRWRTLRCTGASSSAPAKPARPQARDLSGAGRILFVPRTRCIPLDISAEHPEIQRMEALAEHLADVVQSVQPAGPYTLSGHSAGARLALAIAFVLTARGHRTATVVLDMHAPVPGGADQDKWGAADDELLAYIRQMKVVLGEALAVDIDATARMPEEQAWAHIAAILERERLLPPGGGVAMLRRTILLRRRVFTLLADYVPTTPYPGRLVLLSVAAWAVTRSRRVAIPLVVGALALADQRRGDDAKQQQRADQTPCDPTWSSSRARCATIRAHCL